MRLLNLCCGAVRPQSEEWINLDNLYPVLPIGSPERTNLENEPNFRQWEITENGKLPFEDEEFDGIVASHCVEHWDLHQSVRVLKECWRILKYPGYLIVSVPDAAIFREKHWFDYPDLAVRNFGEPIHEADGEQTFMGYAGFNRFHKQLLSEDSLWCILYRAGFHRILCPGDLALHVTCDMLETMKSILNRLPFSLILRAEK